MLAIVQVIAGLGLVFAFFWLMDFWACQSYARTRSHALHRVRRSGVATPRMTRIAA